MLDEHNILILFAGLLMERRIIFCGSQLSSLTNCIQTAVALVYPFSWQHIYIPVLPRSLLSFVCAPMPFVVGILESDLAEVMSNPMDEVLLINIDTNQFIMAPTGIPDDELANIPEEYLETIRKTLKAGIKQIKKMRRRKKEFKAPTASEMQIFLSQQQYEMKLLKKELTAAFINFFVRLLGSYRNYIAGNKFDREGFIQGQPECIRQLLENLSAVQMFECFIDEKLRSGDTSGFDSKIDYNDRIQLEMDKIRAKGEVPQMTKKGPNRVGWSSLRKPFKKEQPQELILGAPTLVQGSSELLSSGKQVIPLRSSSESPVPAFIIPSKPLPRPPTSSKSMTEVVRAPQSFRSKAREGASTGADNINTHQAGNLSFGSQQPNKNQPRPAQRGAYLRGGLPSTADRGKPTSPVRGNGRGAPPNQAKRGYRATMSICTPPNKPAPPPPRPIDQAFARFGGIISPRNAGGRGAAIPPAEADSRPQRSVTMRPLPNPGAPRLNPLDPLATRVNL